uniref:Secreted protein n=1 Tax=Haemonchus placei TaxID=6290 RepID=A0A0N4X7Y3_HAEPC
LLASTVVFRVIRGFFACLSVSVCDVEGRTVPLWRNAFRSFSWSRYLLFSFTKSVTILRSESELLIADRQSGCKIFCSLTNFAQSPSL